MALPPNIERNAEIDEIIQTVLKDWEASVHQKLSEAIRREKLTTTGALLGSLRATLKSASSAYRFALEYHFYDHGRYRDMKKLNYGGKMPPFNTMVDWVKKVGIQRFKYIPGYPRGVFPIGNSKSKWGTGNKIVENRIAWGFMKHIQKTGYYKRASSRKSWYNKVLWGELDELIQALMDGLRENTLHLLKKEFEQHI